MWWADLGEPDGSEPRYRRPVVIVQSDAFNRSRLRTAGRLRDQFLHDVDKCLRLVLAL
ncbi:MAG TPA: type II toxin-antitoxin system PemK/MazF family toxin [Gammaproteobacteria bacterium]|nr:type II toxin-antitoxin system PemK/MazF family toxin [Gammaproteobacteria bacterium]